MSVFEQCTWYVHSLYTVCIHGVYRVSIGLSFVSLLSLDGMSGMSRLSVLFRICGIVVSCLLSLYVDLSIRLTQEWCLARGR